MFLVSRSVPSSQYLKGGGKERGEGVYRRRGGGGEDLAIVYLRIAAM